MRTYVERSIPHVPTGLLARELEELLSDRHGGRVRIADLERTPIPQGSSFAIEEVLVHIEDGRTLALVFKDFGPGRMIGDADRMRPGFLHKPAREIEVYRSLLEGAGLGTATCHAAVADPHRDRYWLFLERVPGIELYQVGEIEVWRLAARRLAQVHRRFGTRCRTLRRMRCLVKYEPAFYRLWPLRACAIAGRTGSADDLRALQWLAARFAPVVERLASLPPTLVHGDCWASNILVERTDGGFRICPVDWEMAGLGPGLVDLAALTTGWSDAEATSIAVAYRDAMGAEAPSLDQLLADLDACRLHLALRCLGWSARWSPPPDHDRDWLAEALTLAERLEL